MEIRKFFKFYFYILNAASQKYFHLSPNQLDALVFAHVHSLSKLNLPSPIQDIALIIRRHPLLMNHSYSIQKVYFNDDHQSIDDFELIESSSEDSIINGFDTFENYTYTDSMFEL